MRYCFVFIRFVGYAPLRVPRVALQSDNARAVRAGARPLRNVNSSVYRIAEHPPYILFKMYVIVYMVDAKAMVTVTT